MNSKKLASKPLPKHVAIIMDGNRRWARGKGLPELLGHKYGADALEKVIEAAAQMGLKTLTVFALSTENIVERTPEEIAALFKLLDSLFYERSKELSEKGVRVQVLGERVGLPSNITEIIDRIHAITVKKEVIHVNVCLNYGGRAEILRAVKNLLQQGIRADKVTEEVFSRNLFTAGQADPDLMIRTGGRNRLSNYLLWQTSYAEVFFTPTLWPDFDGRGLKEAITWFQNQTRNFGK